MIRIASMTMDDDLGEIEQFVKVAEEELRFGIQIQLDDLTNALIGKEEVIKVNRPPRK